MPLGVQIPRRRGLRQNLQHQFRNRIVELCGTARSGVVRLQQIRFRRHHHQIRLDPVHRAALPGSQLQMGDLLRQKNVGRPGQRAAANPVAGRIEHVLPEPAGTGVVVDQHAVLFEFTEMHAFGAVVGIGRPVVVVLVGDIVWIVGIKVRQAFQIVLPRRQMLEPPDNPLLPRRARHGCIDVPFPHVPIGHRLYAFPFPNDRCHDLSPACAAIPFYFVTREPLQGDCRHGTVSISLIRTCTHGSRTGSLSRRARHRLLDTACPSRPEASGQNQRNRNSAAHGRGNRESDRCDTIRLPRRLRTSTNPPPSQYSKDLVNEPQESLLRPPEAGTDLDSGTCVGSGASGEP